ncbi:hypothetical protein [Mesorhizobium sp. CAU 1741]|uniref:hypothetical protein n=1 Tax=Mesorhizobium sp. CAU 1741 TaxID=3140366 RepID=UPI00325C3336
MLVAFPFSAQAEIDGYGPDAWRVVGVGSNDVLNARMGPGTRYPVIETFAHDERGLEQITCVPFYTMAHFQDMAEADRNALPPRWCLMRSADLSRAGWVAQRYIIDDQADLVEDVTTARDDPVSHAVDLVRALYESADLAAVGGPEPLHPDNAIDYFATEVVAAMQSRPLQANPLYGAQAFEGSVSEPKPDPAHPMLRGMITLNVEIVNFGRPQQAVFRLRADPSQPGAPIRIFRIEHESWSFPDNQ